MSQKFMQESVFDNFFIRIGAGSVWKNYNTAYKRYLKDRERCQHNVDTDKLKECRLTVDLKVLILKIKALRQAMPYCKNTKDPNKCRERLMNLINKSNDLLKLKRDELQKLNEKLDNKVRKEIEKQKNLKLNALKAE